MNTRFAVLIYLASASSFAGTLYSFGGNHLVAFEERGRISGAYLAVERADGRSFACQFAFKTIDSSSKKARRRITAWEKNKYFHATANGTLHLEEDGWKIRINFPSQGCKLFPWDQFSNSPHNTFGISEKRPALGIHVLHRRSSYYNPSGTGFEPATSRTDILSKGDLVAAIRKQGEFTYIEHFASWRSYAAESSGWIRSVDLGKRISD